MLRMNCSDEELKTREMTEYRKITPADRELFFKFMAENCREGEDGANCSKETDELCEYVFGKLTLGEIEGRFAVTDEAVGFVLWAAEDSIFCELKGFATILELWVKKEHRLKGVGTGLAECAEREIEKTCGAGVYVCTASSAEGFWKRLGYRKTEGTAMNGLKIFAKSF